MWLTVLLALVVLGRPIASASAQGPVAELKADSIVGPGVVQAGTSSISVSYTVQNLGSVAVTGYAEQIVLRGAGTGNPAGIVLFETVRPGLPAQSGQTFTENIPWPAVPPGSYSLVARVDSGNSIPEIDEANNEATAALTVVGVADTTPPMLQSATTPAAPNGQNGWYTSDVTVTLTATDEPGGSGVKDIGYSLTQGQQTTTQSVSAPTASFQVTADGVTTISASARDNANNASSVIQTSLKLDKTPPVMVGTTMPSVRNDTRVQILLIASDGPAGSGVKEVVYTSTGAQVTPETIVPGEGAALWLTTAGTTTVTFFARDNAGNVGALQAVTVTASSGPPEVSLTPDLVDFGDQVIGVQSAERTVLYANTGLVPLTLQAVQIEGANTSNYAVTGPTLPATVAAGETRAFGIRFTPSVGGPSPARLSFVDDATGEQFVDLRGVGQAPEAAIAPDRLNFGRVLVNSTSDPRTVTVFNTGLAPLTVTAVTITGPDVAAFTVSSAPPLPKVLQPGEALTVSIRLNVTVSRRYIAGLQILHDGTGERGLTLHGNGVERNPSAGAGGKPETNLTPDRVAFGDVPLGSTSPPRAVSVTNTGDAPLTVTGLALAGAQPGDFSLTAPALPATLAPGASLTAQVRFTPTAVGQHTAQLVVTDNAAGEQRSALSGRGQGPEATLAPDRVNFGRLAVGSSLTRSVTLVNTGLAALHLTSVSLAGAAAGDYAVSQTGPATIAPGASVTFTVTCTPTATGARAGSLDLADDAPGEHRVALSCTGT